MIADEQKDDRFLLKMVIRKRVPGLDVVAEAPDAEYLVNYLTGEGSFGDRTQHPFPQLLLLDIRMASVNGFNVIEWIRAQSLPPLKIAVLSDLLPEENRTGFVSAGADYLFGKSCDLHEIESMLKQLELNLGTPA